LPGLRVRIVGFHRYSERLAALQHECAGGLPTADNLIEEAIIVQERFSFAERQLVDSISLECIPDVEV
jgi:hypothetical protein